MLNPGQVPKEVIVELLAALNGCDCDDCMSVAIAAVINAWPDARQCAPGEGWRFRHPHIILPLSQDRTK